MKCSPTSKIWNGGNVLDFLLGLTTALVFVCLVLLGVILLIVLKIMHGVQTVLDIAGAAHEDDDDAPVPQEQVNAPGSIPMPPSLRDRLLPPTSTPPDLSNGTFGGRRGWNPPSTDDDKPAA